MKKRKTKSRPESKLHWIQTSSDPADALIINDPRVITLQVPFHAKFNVKGAMTGRMCGKTGNLIEVER